MKSHHHRRSIQPHQIPVDYYFVYLIIIWICHWDDEITKKKLFFIPYLISQFLKLKCFPNIFFAKQRTTYTSKRSPSDSDRSVFNGWKISSNSKTLEYPFLNNGMVHVKSKTDKKFVFSRGFGGNFRCVDSIFTIYTDFIPLFIYQFFLN